MYSKKQIIEINNLLNSMIETSLSFKYLTVEELFEQVKIKLKNVTGINSLRYEEFNKAGYILLHDPDITGMEIYYDDEEVFTNIRKNEELVDDSRRKIITLKNNESLIEYVVDEIKSYLKYLKKFNIDKKEIDNI